MGIRSGHRIQILSRGKVPTGLPIVSLTKPPVKKTVKKKTGSYSFAKVDSQQWLKDLETLGHKGLQKLAKKRVEENLRLRNLGQSYIDLWNLTKDENLELFNKMSELPRNIRSGTKVVSIAEAKTSKGLAEYSLEVAGRRNGTVKLTLYRDINGVDDEKEHGCYTVHDDGTGNFEFGKATGNGLFVGILETVRWDTLNR